MRRLNLVQAATPLSRTGSAGDIYGNSAQMYKNYQSVAERERAKENKSKLDAINMKKALYKQMDAENDFLAGLKRKGLDVNALKLKKMRVGGKSFVVEKGIDVMIATDMINKTLLEEECECCVLVSGDSDFVPVMELIKGVGKEVLTVSVLRGYARELLQGKFRFWILKKGDVMKCFGGAKKL